MNPERSPRDLDRKDIIPRSRPVTTALALALMMAAAPPAAAHDWYSNKKNPVTEISCCGTVDCVELEADEWRETPDGFSFYHSISNKWYDIPRDQAQLSQNSKAHACARWHPRVNPALCFFYPGGT